MFLSTANVIANVREEEKPLIAQTPQQTLDLIQRVIDEAEKALRELAERLDPDEFTRNAILRGQLVAVIDSMYDLHSFIQTQQDAMRTNSVRLEIETQLDM